MVRIASYNVENLFSRPKAFNTSDWSLGRPILDAYREFNTIAANANYTATDQQRMRDLLVELDIYSINASGAVRRKRSINPKWAWLRKNRGSFDREPRDNTQNVEIIATGRGDWIGWIELSNEVTDEVATQLTAQVILDVDADIIGIVEAEDRPSLVRLNNELLHDHYGHVMLVDGNDTRGIDVGILTKTPFEISTIRSHVDDTDHVGIVFSRDCPDYEISIPGGPPLHVLVNHFKSQSGGGGTKRQRQAKQVRSLVDDIVAAGERAVVLGDLNEGQTNEATPATNFADLYDPAGPLTCCYDLAGFDTGPRPGTFDSCGIRNRLDYIFITKNLQPAFAGGGIFREGLWGTRETRPDKWSTYAAMSGAHQQASDHAAVFVDLNL